MNDYKTVCVIQYMQFHAAGMVLFMLNKNILNMSSDYNAYAVQTIMHMHMYPSSGKGLSSVNG